MSLTKEEKKCVNKLFGEIDRVVNNNFKVIVNEICNIRKDLEIIRKSMLTFVKVGKFSLQQLAERELKKPKKKK